MDKKKLKKMLAEKFSVISVDGPIGVGKTTLVKRASEVFDIPCVCDEKGSPELLKEFYGNRDKYGFPTQVHFAVNRHKKWTQILERGHKGTVLADFMPIRDLLFAGHNLKEHEFAVFSQLHTVLFPEDREPDAIVYLTADTDVLMKRIAKRGRSFENKITRKYIESVANMFHKHFLACEGKTVLVVNTNDYNIVEDSDSVVDIFEQLLHTRSELQYYTPPVK